MNLVKQGPGRPKKYGRLSRAVTVTLPEDVLARLTAIDTDLGRSIVRLVERSTPAHPTAARPAEMASYGSHAVIIVTPVEALKRLAGVQLVPIGNGRALISLEHSQSISQLELAIRDAIDADRSIGPERETLEAIADILRQARQSGEVVLEERTIIVLTRKRRRRSSVTGKVDRRDRKERSTVPM
jgi:hypothetical protein